MISFKNTMDMYDRFIDRDYLSTQDLLALGFNKNDLTKMIENGKLKRPRRGYYEVGNVDGLFNYVKILFGKRFRNTERAIKGLNKCVRLAPENKSIQTRVFLNAIFEEKYDDVFKAFEFLDKTDNEFYKQDNNFWLYLLSFITEVPEQYKERIKNMTFEDMMTLDGDKRFSDKITQNNLRRNAFNQRFKNARSMEIPDTDKKINYAISDKLLSYAVRQNIEDHNHLFELIFDGNYEEAISLLEGAKEFRGLNRNDNNILIVLKDLVSIMDGVIPEVNYEEVNAVTKAIKNHNLERALDLLDKYDSDNKNRTNKCLTHLINKYLDEKKKLGVSDAVTPVVEDEFDLDKEIVASKKMMDKTEDDLFGQLTISLMNQNMDEAYSYINRYLSWIDKSKYRYFIEDMARLDYLNGDKSFQETMCSLTDIKNDQFEYYVSSYIQGFYFNLARKEFNKAALYLDILSMSQELGGVKFSVYDMKSRLLEDSGMSEEELGFRKKEEKSNSEKEALVPAENVISVSDVMSEVKSEFSDDVRVETSDEETIVPQDDDAFIEEPGQVAYALVDVVDQLLDDTNLIMLQPMSEEDIQRVVQTTQNFPQIQTIVFEEETGEKRVVLRYYNKHGEYVNFKETLQEANRKYNNWEYEDAIELFQSVLPKLESPKAFIYSKLGFAYMKTTYDGDYSKAIDYLTMASVTKDSSSVDIDYGKVIRDLKTKCNYNGRVISSDESCDSRGSYVKK